MRRLNNWPSRFAALEASVRLEPFAWGTHDCCLWSANTVLAITGVDPAAEWRGSYDTRQGALRLLARLGGLRGVGARAGGAIRPSTAVVGDIGLVVWDDGVRSLAVCGGFSWLCVGDRGPVHLTMNRAECAWGVGRE